MSCRTCLELEQFLHSAQTEGSPELLLGLTEAGKRNRLQQRSERIAKLETDLRRHRESCQELRADTEPAEVTR